MKKLTVIITAVIILLCSCIAVNAETVYRYGDWTLSASTGAGGYAFSVRSYDGSDAVVTVPGDYGGYPVTAINAYAFAANKTVRKLTLNEKNTAIGEGAFFAAEKLETVTLTPSVDTIGKNAFAQCENLTKIEIPGNDTEISDNAFQNSPKAVIYAASNSSAVAYAKEHKIDYVCTDEPEPVLGDVNCDGFVSIGDVTELQRHIAGLIKLNSSALLRADINQDGRADISDATAIQMFIAEYD